MGKSPRNNPACCGTSFEPNPPIRQVRLVRKGHWVPSRSDRVAAPGRDLIQPWRRDGFHTKTRRWCAGGEAASDIFVAAKPAGVVIHHAFGAHDIFVSSWTLFR